jgi:hypothetical protein
VVEHVYHAAMGRGGRFLLTGLLVLLATLAFSLTHASHVQAASDPFNGTWQCCGDGGAAEQVFVINGNGGQADDPDGGPKFATITGSYNYPSAQIVTTYTGSSYVATFKGTISNNNTTMSGTWTSNEGQSGTWTATKGTAVTTSPSLTIVLSSLTFSIGKQVTATVTVTAGTTAIANASLGPGPVVQGGYATVSSPPSGSHDINLAAGASQTFVYTLTGVKNGGGLINVALTGTQSDGFAGTTATAYSKFQVGDGLSPVAPSGGSGLKLAAAPIASSIGTPGEIFHDLGHNAANAGITVAVILFITFPANIFNNTFSSNYGEILLILAGFKRRVRRSLGLKNSEPVTKSSAKPPLNAAAGAVTATAVVATESSINAPAMKTNVDEPGRTSRFGFFGVLVLGAILGGLLDPKFGFNRQSATDLGATFVSFAFGAGISWYITKVFRAHHKYPTRTYLRALPFGLAIAALCVVISRLTSFEPGYLYGVVVGIAFAESIEERHNAHLTVISTCSTLIVALVAWFIWIPVNHLALTHTGNVPIGLLDDVLGSIFVGGLVGTVIGLMPLQFMPGATLLKWRKDVWVIVFFIAIFLLVEVELNPASGPTHHGSAPVVTALVLFVGFGGATIWMRHFFSQRVKAKTAPTALTPAAAVTTSGVMDAPLLGDDEADESDD